MVDVTSCAENGMQLPRNDDHIQDRVAKTRRYASERLFGNCLSYSKRIPHETRLSDHRKDA